ncbi:hypothetical protein DUI87_20042 [Hirundo rustica rustica]|uniref:Uncharacterized protein n=1 Tax=Hirundo rustica rustica TaxID=333673 RepID=A0A3M0JVR4_HIRRU|nr:hypothetical protein DUI87_20042 [Hirundo rustica rustica]
MLRLWLARGRGDPGDRYPGASAVIPEDEERLGMSQRDLETPFSQNDTSAERLWMMEPERRNSMALKNASDIANSVVEDGLEGGGISFCSAMSSADQKEGSNAHSFSADE